MLCECGCGVATAIARETNTKWGHVAGQPVRFIRGHHARLWKQRNTGAAISCALRGKSRPSIQGPLNHNWKGGPEVWMERSRNPRLTARWKRRVKQRDKVCQDCGSDQQLRAHHIFPYATHPEQGYNVNNGILLCHDCHMRVHRCLRITEAQE